MRPSKGYGLGATTQKRTGKELVKEKGGARVFLWFDDVTQQQARGNYGAECLEGLICMGCHFKEIYKAYRKVPSSTKSYMGYVKDTQGTSRLGPDTNLLEEIM